MKLETKSLLRSPNESMVLGDNFMNHDLIDPFKVARLSQRGDLPHLLILSTVVS